MSGQSSKIRTIFVSILVAVTALGLIFLIYLQATSYPALEDTASCYINNPTARVESDRISFFPDSSNPAAGIIIYPGGNVDFEAYAPLAGRLSAGGYAVFIQKMPLNLAVFGIDRGNRILTDYPDIQSWILVGHSLGGAMAARFAAQNTETIDALVFLAAYPDIDLTDTPLNILSITGSEDGILNRERFENAKTLLPSSTRYLTIDGANHAGFGHYGPQRGDGEAWIPPDQQLNRTAAAILQWIQETR